jgi:hypothetical protein
MLLTPSQSENLKQSLACYLWGRVFNRTKHINRVFIIGLAIMLNACSGLALEDYKTETPPFRLEEF